MIVRSLLRSSSSSFSPLFHRVFPYSHGLGENMQGLLFSPQRRMLLLLLNISILCTVECIHCLVAMARTIVYLCCFCCRGLRCLRGQGHKGCESAALRRFFVPCLAALIALFPGSLALPRFCKQQTKHPYLFINAPI